MQENSTLMGPSARPFKVKDVAAFLGVDASTVYVACRTGLLGSYRVGVGRGTIRIPRSALKAYADERGIPAEALGVAL
ncbi:helix-turn-helix domain-containing protein [Streptomyces sp. NPDC040724]|uniref:helix-turn-helix domain-containing protein n=1 Tax=Streptomyces sp. NPDC040724 TaxID=3155612 RepID=UPI0033DFD18A